MAHAQITRAQITEDNGMPILAARGLAKSFGRRQVVKGVDLEVERGEIVGLLGPNGAGKTTSFRMICGMLEPERGQVFLNGHDVTRWPMYRRARDGGMGYLAQESSVFRKLTVEQNLLAMLELLGVKRKARQQRCDALLEQFRITHIRKSPSAKLSGGERRRLEIARCLVSDPEIIMLDEPFAGIDPVTVQGIQEIIQQLQQRDIAILITDHAALAILQIVDRCYVIADGQVLCNGTPQDVVRHPEVRTKYLGEIDTFLSRKSSSAGDPSPSARSDSLPLSPPSRNGGPASVEPGNVEPADERPSNGLDPVQDAPEHRLHGAQQPALRRPRRLRQSAFETPARSPLDTASSDERDDR